MSNLIVTIISIILVGIAALMAIYYGGTAFENAQINAIANSIMNEAQQILYAERIWSTNNNQPDISGMGTVGASGTGMSALVNGKILAQWPSFGGTMGFSTNLDNPGPQPSTGNITTGLYDRGCYNINGYAGKFDRTIFSFNYSNYVLYYFTINVPYTAPCQTFTGNFISSATDVSQINHPIVKIAKAINIALGQIPRNANFSAMPYIGLPSVPSGSTATTLSNVYDPSITYASGFSSVYLDPSGQLQTNYCYLTAMNTRVITCVFGPS